MLQRIPKIYHSQLIIAIVVQQRQTYKLHSHPNETQNYLCQRTCTFSVIAKIRYHGEVILTRLAVAVLKPNFILEGSSKSSSF